MNVRAAIVVVSSIVSIGGSISGCAGDDPAVSAETSTGPSDSGTGDPWYAEGDAPPGLELVGACAAV